MSGVFHLLRHGAHSELGRVLTGRKPGVGLSDTGRAEARALAARLAELQADALLVSPQARAAETAALIAEGTGLVPETDADLDEIDFGAWSGTTFASLADDLAWTAWNDARDTARTPAGDTMHATADRLTGLIDRLRAAHPGRSVALVSHSDVIKAGICHYLGLSFANIHRFEISPASITTLVVGDWGGTLITLNERPTPEKAAQ